MSSALPIFLFVFRIPRSLVLVSHQTALSPLPIDAILETRSWVALFVLVACLKLNGAEVGSSTRSFLPHLLAIVLMLPPLLRLLLMAPLNPHIPLIII